MGSSPCSRGARHLRVVRDRRPGPIPAFAGSTRRARRTRAASRAHPRDRGEHAVGRPAPVVGRGSSPRSLGAHRQLRRRHARLGLIPAFAGSTLTPPLPSTGPRAYPRVRGEHSACVPNSRCAGGSSPRSRGAPHRRSGLQGQPGLIPAFAGSTSQHSPAFTSPWAHPRVRGEPLINNLTEPAAWGSSPRSRGALEAVPAAHAEWGLIPRSRGAHGPLLYSYFAPGLIPAFAGST